MKISETAQPVASESCADVSRCEACGEPFACGALTSGCWCMEVKLSERTRARLSERYTNCLCRACLERFAEEDGAGLSHKGQESKRI